MSKLFTTVAVATLLAAAPALAADPAKMPNDPAQKANSGPGVQGPEGTRTGPAAKTPDDGGAASGTSSGDTGTDNTTQPSQDSSGVQGAQDSTNGPSDKKPSGSEQK